MELTAPLSIIDGLFAKHAAGGNAPAEWGEREHFIQALGLLDEEAFRQIPCLNDTDLAESVRPFTLVRYRGLVQDIFEPEMYVACVEERAEAAAAGSGALRTTKYREYVEAGPGKAIHELGNEGLGQRGAYYCVPLPGETAWARAAAGAAAKAGAAGAKARRAPSPETAAPARTKRGRDEDTCEEMGVSEAPETTSGEPTLRARTGEAVGEMVSGEKAFNADEFGLNFPLPWEEARGRGASTACIVKTYDQDAEALRLCDTVEVLGVLCVNPEMANLEAPVADLFGNDARQPSTALVPRLHAIMVRKLPFYHPMLPFTPDFLSEARLASAFQSTFSGPGAVAAARATALARLAGALGWDTLAAEYVLMSLLSRSFGKHGDQLLGVWSLNLTRWPEELDVQAFSAAAGQLVPRAVCLEVSAKSLGEKRWKPSKDYGANRLLASQLQLAPGTLLVLDETKMAEGKLNAAGVTSIKALGTLVTEHKLSCDFSAYDIGVPLELSIVLVSKGRSIVKDVEVAMPLQPGAGAPAGGAEALDATRGFFGLATRLPKALDIPDDVAQRLAGDFAEVRQEFQVETALCNTWLSLARAYCLSHGEETLSQDRWSQLLALEQQRLRRCQEAGMLVPAAGTA